MAVGEPWQLTFERIRHALPHRYTVTHAKACQRFTRDLSLGSAYGTKPLNQKDTVFNQSSASTLRNNWMPALFTRTVAGNLVCSCEAARYPVSYTPIYVPRGAICADTHPFVEYRARRSPKFHRLLRGKISFEIPGHNTERFWTVTVFSVRRGRFFNIWSFYLHESEHVL